MINRQPHDRCRDTAYRSLKPALQSANGTEKTSFGSSFAKAYAGRSSIAAMDFGFLLVRMRIARLNLKIKTISFMF